jgi:S-adenosylmethionine:tRNA ribosyltransferase-isomerase
MNPRDISIEAFDYTLPEERIARFPLEERDLSKLLIWKEEQVSEDTYRNIAGHLPENALLVFNNTKVVQARLVFQKPTGGLIEIFCLEPDERYPDITTAMLTKERVWWNCLVGGASKWKQGSLSITVTRSDTIVVLEAIKKEVRSGHFNIEFSWQPAAWSFAEVLEAVGQIPLPPYLNRAVEATDKERYQTIYAKEDGSVAAPTAGLHFTNAIFESMAAKHIDTGFVTLHVGAGTFMPVKATTLEGHEMHTEFIEVDTTTLDQLIGQAAGTIIAVGTTSLRTIESLYWLGLKTIQTPNIAPTDLQVYQWDAYHPDLPQGISATESLQSLKAWMQVHSLQRLVTRTQLLVAPGYRLKVAKALITNFHQPRSTLLLLIAAIVGDNWSTIYQYALDHDFRFLSYGDGGLLWNAVGDNC